MKPYLQSYRFNKEGKEDLVSKLRETEGFSISLPNILHESLPGHKSKLILPGIAGFIKQHHDDDYRISVFTADYLEVESNPLADFFETYQEENR